jgi:ABC-2 type transport system permease protein
MSEMRNLFWLKARLFTNTVRSVSREPLFKSVIVALFATLWMVGIFFLVSRGISFMREFPGIGDYLISKLFYLFSFALFAMLVLSNALLAHSVLYARRENLLLYSMPISRSAIVSCKLWETIFLGSWAFALTGVPLLVAYFLSSGTGMYLFFLSWLYFIPLIFLCGAIGLCISMIFVRYVPRFRSWMVWFLAGFLALAGVIIVWRYRGGYLAGADPSLYFVNQIVARCRFAGWFMLPSRWVVDGIFSLGQGRYGNAAFLWILLFSNAVFLYSICKILGESLLFQGWDRRVSYSSAAGRARMFSLKTDGSVFRSFLSKDVVTFFRDSSQWGQFALFFGLLGVYILNLRNLPYDLGNLFWRYLLFMLNISALGFTLSALSSRFFFPLVSLELRRYWFLGLTPIGFRQLLRQKYILCTGFTVAITLVLALLSALMLGVSRLLLLSSLVSVVFMGMAVSGLSVGIGALYPNLKASTSAEVVSGIGGTMILVAGLMYVCVSLSIQAVPLFLHWKGFVSDSLFPWCILGSVCALGAVSVMAAFFSLKAGGRRLGAMDL